MANVITRPGWHLPEKAATPENAFFNRRAFLKELGWGSAAAAAAGAVGCSRPAQGQPKPDPAVTPANVAAGFVGSHSYPAPRNPAFNPGWRLTDWRVAAHYNNFYEFTTTKDAVWRLVGRFQTAPWPVEISGLVENPMTLDARELIALFPLEERVYRFRCVEAWAMIVPWTGFPLSKLLEKVRPKSEAKYVRFVSFYRPDWAPGFANRSFPWPYTEGLRLEEAMNVLTLVVTGIYGKPLPKQHGAPVRIIVPWKYGYKSIKSILKIELVAQEPATLWDTVAPDEYPFESNVNPNVPHPRWSQRTERMIDTGDRVNTRLYNGYGAYVSQLYPRA